MRRAMRAGAVAGLVMTALVSGCDCGGGVTSVAPTMEVAPEKIDFGKVSVGSAAEQLVDVRNTGRGTLEVTSIKVTIPSKGDAGQDEVAVVRAFATDCQGNARAGGDLNVAGGECARFAVRYAPSAVHALASEVTIESNDVDRPTLKIPVAGAGVSAKVRLCVLTPAGEEEAGACTHFDSTDPAEAARLPEVAFGAAPIGETAKRAVRVHNDGEGELVVAAVNVVSDVTDFAVEGAPVSMRLAPGKLADVVAIFQPTGDGPETGKLQFLLNDLARPTVELPMTAEAQGPRLCIDPPNGLDFGSIPLNTSRLLTLTLKNCGYAKYNVTALDFQEDGLATPVNFKITAPNVVPQLPHLLAPGDSLPVDLTYTPSAVATHSGAFSIKTDYQTGRVPVTGKGEASCGGSARPVAAVKVKVGTRDITATASTTGVEPLTTVTFDGTTSSVPRGGNKYKWRLVSQPSNGTQNLSISGGTARLFAELDGDYVVELVAGDQYSCDSEPKQVRLHVASTGKVHVQLTWKESWGDVDLHLVGPGGTFNNTRTDCFYANCNKNDLYLIDWGANNTTGADGNRTNDPTLDIDDIWGNGPENITHDLPFNGTYKVIVHYYCSKDDFSRQFGAATPEVKIFVNGQISGTTLKLPASTPFTQGKKWHVADVVVSNNGQTVQVNPVAISGALPSSTGTENCGP